MPCAQLLAMLGVASAEVDSAIVASVVPRSPRPWSALVKRAFGREALVVGPGIKTGMAILYENPREVGADRIVNAVAGYERAKGGVIVVDFGTATTFDCVTPKGEYLGGVIAPGLQISAEALFSRAAKLPRVEIAKPPQGRRPQHRALHAVGHRLRLRGPRRRPRRPHPRRARLPLRRHRHRRARVAHRAAVAHDRARSTTMLTLEGLRILYERNTRLTSRQRFARPPPARSSSSWPWRLGRRLRERPIHPLRPLLPTRRRARAPSSSSACRASLLGALAGGGLAAVGVAFQAVLRNPLAEPYVLGVSGGAALGATVAIAFGAAAASLLGASARPRRRARRRPRGDGLVYGARARRRRGRRRSSSPASSINAIAAAFITFVEDAA